MVEKNIERKTNFWMSLFVLVMAVMYVLASLGRIEFLQYVAVVFGFFLAGFLFIQSGIKTYFERKEYKKISIGDFVVFATVIFGALVLLNSLFLINLIRNVVPVGLLNFVIGTGVVVGSGAGILAIIHLLFPRFK